MLPFSILSFNEGFDTETRTRLKLWYQRERQVYARHSDDWNLAWVDYSLGNLARADNDLKQSEDLLRRSLQHFRASDDLYGQAWALDALSTTYRRDKAT